MEEKKGKKFITEKILGRNLTWERALKYLGLSLLCGLVFGLAAVGVFSLLVRPAQKVAEEMTEAVTEAEMTSAEPETAPPETTQQEPETEPSTAEETTEPQTTEEVTEEETTRPQTTEAAEEDATEEAVTETSSEEEPLSEAGNEEVESPEETEPESAVVSAEDRACAVRESILPVLVEAEVVASAETWFESTVETRQSFSGIVLQKTEDEILVLVPMGIVDAERKIIVTFAEGAARTGIPKAYSRRDGLAVLAVPIAGMNRETLEKILPAEISEEEVKTGTWVLAAGAPLGENGSVDAGVIGYVSGAENGIDTSFHCVYSSVFADYEKGTYVFDGEGKLLGIALAADGRKVCEGTRIVLAKSMERLINNMKAGSNSPYLGITGADSEAPGGMYVTGVEPDSPAYEAGLQRGDVIVMAGIREIRKVDDFMGFMRNLHPGETVTIAVKRADGSGGYADIEIEVQAGARD